MVSEKTCSKCGQVNKSEDKFCSSCGYNLLENSVTEKPIACLSCGVVNSASNAFCSSCGISLQKKDSVVSAKIGKKQNSKKNQKNSSQQAWVKPFLGIFIAVVIVIAGIEFYKAPNGEMVHNGGNAGPQNQLPMQQQAPPENNADVIKRISELEMHIASNPNDISAELEFANRLQDARFYPRAIEAYKKYLQKNSKDVDARVDLGICYFESGDFAVAVKEIESALVQQPRHQMAMFNLGIIYLNQKEVVKSNEWFSKCVAVNPSTDVAQRAQQILNQHKQN